MRIGLVAGLMKDNNIDHQIQQIELHLKSNKNCDLLCFGESYLQGFEGLTWQYEQDLNRALALDDPIILKLRGLAKAYDCALSFSFIEKDIALYCTNMVIDKQGEIIDVFRRVSTGWKEPIANHMYQEGTGFHQFTFMNKVFAVAICGDLFNDTFLAALKHMELDALLWPLYVDYTVDEWQKTVLQEYTQRAGNLEYPVLMINSFVEEPNCAKGGCYVFHENAVESSLPLGNLGVLEFQLDSSLKIKGRKMK